MVVIIVLIVYGVSENINLDEINTVMRQSTNYKFLLQEVLVAELKRRRNFARNACNLAHNGCEVD